MRFFSRGLKGEMGKAVVMLSAVFLLSSAFAEERIKVKLIFSSTIQHLASDIFLLENPQGKPINLTKGGWPNNFPDWSPDGERIAFRGLPDKGLYLMELAEGKVKPLLNMIVGSFDWSPDGRRIAFWDYKGKRLRILDLLRGELETVPCQLDIISLAGLSWSPEGDEVACGAVARGRNKYDLYVINVETEEFRNLTNSPDDNDFFPCWSPDGGLIFSCSDREGSVLFDVYAMDVEGEVVWHLRLEGSQWPVDVFDPSYAYRSLHPIDLKMVMWGMMKSGGLPDSVTPGLSRTFRR